MNEEDYVELLEDRAIIYLPEHSLEVKMDITAWVAGSEEDTKGHIVEVTRTLNATDLKEAFEKAAKGYIDDDDRFVLTEKGRQYLEELEAKNA